MHRAASPINSHASLRVAGSRDADSQRSSAGPPKLLPGVGAIIARKSPQSFAHEWNVKSCGLARSCAVSTFSSVMVWRRPIWITAFPSTFQVWLKTWPTLAKSWVERLMKSCPGPWTWKSAIVSCPKCGANEKVSLRFRRRRARRRRKSPRSCSPTYRARLHHVLHVARRAWEKSFDNISPVDRRKVPTPSQPPRQERRR